MLQILIIAGGSGLMAFGMNSFVSSGVAEGALIQPQQSAVEWFFENAAPDKATYFSEMDALVDELNRMRLSAAS